MHFQADRQKQQKIQTPHHLINTLACFLYTYQISIFAPGPCVLLCVIVTGGCVVLKHVASQLIILSSHENTILINPISA